MAINNFFTFFGKKGFDNERYLRAQTDAITERASKFTKIYLEFGGKLLYDYHAAHVLPGYELDTKMHVIKKLAEKRPVEFLFCVSARDLESEKKMSALGISYRDFSIKMLENIRMYGFYVPNVVINLFSGEQKAKEFGNYLKKQKYRVYYRELIKGYPNNLNAIASRFGYGKKPFIKTDKPIVIVAGAGPNSGKMATCLTMIYQDYLQKKDSGYAKFESFPIWNIPLISPINAAYEAATVDINDYNLIDPYHLEAYKIEAVNYNRDISGFSIIKKIFGKIISRSNFMRAYKSPTDMGINKMKEGITDIELCERAARQEIIRRYFSYKSDFFSGVRSEECFLRVGNIMKKSKILFSERPIIALARKTAGKPLHNKWRRGLCIGRVGCALMLSDSTIVCGTNSLHMHAESAAIMNALKKMAKIKANVDILWPKAIEQIRKLRKIIYNDQSENLSVPEILIVLAISAKIERNAAKAFAKIKKLHSCELHTTHLLCREDSSALRALGINFTSDGKIEVGKIHIG
ncbi:MAG: DUF1846 domain-containing protein [Candidatus Micrarchaeota archaeon]